MKDHTTITVKPWLFDKLSDEMRRYHFLLVCEYTDVNGLSMADHSKLRVEEVLAETEKAYKVKLDVETENAGHPRTYTAWLPKSAIIDDGDPKKAKVYRVVFDRVNDLGETVTDDFTNNGAGFDWIGANDIAAQLVGREGHSNIRVEVFKATEEKPVPMSYEALRMMVMRAGTIEKVRIAENALRASDLDNEQFDELMGALAEIAREIHRGESA